MQHLTTSEVYVLWENGDLAGEALRWGPDASLGSEVAADPVEGAIREAHLTGLQPDTRYHYEVGDSGSGGVFRTPPLDGGGDHDAGGCDCRLGCRGTPGAAGVLLLVGLWMGTRRWGKRNTRMEGSS